MPSTGYAPSIHRARWAAVGAAVAVALGAGGIGIVRATAPAGASAYVPIAPCRLADTRPAPDNVGPKTSALGPNETWTLDGWGDHGLCTGPAALPINTTGLQLNVTAVGATQLTFLTIFPAGTTMPLASSLNPAPGTPPVPNAVTVSLAADGRFSVFNREGNVNVIIDVVGYYTDHNHDDRYYTKGQTDAAVANRAGRTQSIIIPPTAFTPDEDTGAFDLDLATGARGGSSGLGVLRAPVTLPIGSEVTQITYYVFDNDAGNINLGANTGRFASNTTASWAPGTASSGASTATRPFVTTLATPHVVKDNETMVIFVSANPWTANLGVKGVRIDYILPS